MNKYRPGGRCGGDGGSGGSGGRTDRCGGPGATERLVSEGGLGKSYAAMMAARDRQDAMWAGPQGGQATQGQIVVAQQGAQGARAQGAKETRKNDMNIILQGDFAD